METVGDRIKKMRKQKKLSQEELASLIGVNLVTLSRYETGDRNPKLDKLVAMSQIFNVNVEYITTGEDVVTIPKNEYEQLKEYKWMYEKLAK